MATAGGPNIESDGLVLALDAANDRSFRGEPTTNVVTNWNLDTGWSKGYTEDIVFDEIPPPPGVNAPTVGFRNDDTSGDGYWYSYGNYAPQDSSTTYTISVYAKTNQTDSRFFLRAYTANNSEVGRHWTNGIYLTAADGWKRIVWPSFTTVANNESDSLSFRYDNLYQNGYTRLWLCAPQMEAKSSATRFTTGTRGTTVATGGGWVDRSGNGNHGEILNGTTTSNDGTIIGALDFDGVDDYITLGNNSELGFTNGIFSVETWVYIPSSWTAGSQYPNLVSKGAKAGWDTDGWSLFCFRDRGSPPGYSLGIGMRNSGTTNIREVLNVTSDNWLHVVGTADGSTIKIYINGTQELSNSQTINPASNSTEVLIGRDSNVQYFPGKLAGVKLYNRALSATEVLQNYNATKGRFGL